MRFLDFSYFNKTLRIVLTEAAVYVCLSCISLESYLKSILLAQSASTHTEKRGYLSPYRSATDAVACLGAIPDKPQYKVCISAQFYSSLPSL